MDCLLFVEWMDGLFDCCGMDGWMDYLIAVEWMDYLIAIELLWNGFLLNL